MTSRARSSSRPEHELALLLSGTAAWRAAHRDRLTELTATTDFASFEAFLREQGILALVAGRLRETIDPGLPASFHEHVHRYSQLAQRQNLSQAMLTLRLIAALNQAGIRVLPLKGPLLGERLYGQTAVRVSADIDLLVAKADLYHAVDIVTGLGYLRSHALANGSHPPLHERLVHPGGLPIVELHWRIHWYEERFSEQLLARSTIGAGGYLQPHPQDELAELLLLYARDGFAGIRYPIDIAAWWDRYRDRLNRDGIGEVAREHPAIAPALATAAVLAARLVGVPAHRLLDADALAQASPLAMRLVNWPLSGKQSQIRANVSLVGLALSPPRDRPGLFCRNLRKPLREMVASGAHVGRVEAMRTTSLHTVRLLIRYLIALSVIAYRRTWSRIPESIEQAMPPLTPG